MIIQSKFGLNSRSEANPYNEDGFLPLMTAPMFSVVDETNYQVFLDNKIQVCLPRTVEVKNNLIWKSVSLDYFEKYWIQDKNITAHCSTKDSPQKICIDTANGNMPRLHDTIRKAKELYGNKLLLMTGNVSSCEAFIELAKTGVDYIRVGIGGGGGCNTTSNTGVGQEDLEKLVYYCNAVRKKAQQNNDIKNVSTVKIVADGISYYVKYCEKEYGFNDNGYAAINMLLFSGADIVMIGGLFVQCLESAGNKSFKTKYNNEYHPCPKRYKDEFESMIENGDLYTKYSGMSTQYEQQKYQSNKQNLKPSEGSSKWIPVRWNLNDWLNGSENQDKAPYLMGWINSIKSAMAYTGKTKL